MSRFATARRGYDVKEVDGYCLATETKHRRELAVAEKRIAALTEENKRLQIELAALNSADSVAARQRAEQMALTRVEIVNERINAVWVRLEQTLRESENTETLNQIAEAEGFFVGAKIYLADLLKKEFGIDLGEDGPDSDAAFQRIRNEAAKRWLKY